MNKTILLLVVLVTAISCTQYVPITKYFDGVTIGYPDAKFQIDAYLDLLCIDCKHHMVLLNQLYKRISLSTQKQIKIVYHYIPLPWHYTAYPITMFQHFLNSEHGSLIASSFQDEIYQNQFDFNNTSTQGKSMNQVIDQFAQFAELKLKKIGMTKSIAVEAMNTRAYDLSVRAGWKLGSSFGVTGTPTFFANGIIINDAADFTIEGWLQFFSDHGINFKSQDGEISDEFIESFGPK